MSFVTTEIFYGVDRLMANPPGPIAKNVQDLGSDVTRTMFRYQSSEFNRFLLDAWQPLQTGIAFALLASVLLTAHRNRYLIVISAAMAALVLIAAFYVTPAMMAFGRAFDFVPPAAASAERDNYEHFEFLYSVIYWLNLTLGLSMAARLLFDRMGWKVKLTAGSGTEMRRKLRHRTPEEKLAAGAGALQRRAALGSGEPEGDQRA